MGDTEQKTRALAEKHGIRLQTVSTSFILVLGPQWANDEAVARDPFRGDHYAESWDDALEMVEAYIRLIEACPELVAQS